MNRVWVFVAMGVAVVAAGAGGFIAGHVHGTLREAEDHALQGLMQSLATAHYLDKSQPEELTKSNNAFIDGFLTQLNVHAGANTDPDWIRAKVRTLNAIALHWEKHPPFENASWRTQPQDWSADWEQSHAKSLALLKWAKAECAAHPEYECKKSL